MMLTSSKPDVWGGRMKVTHRRTMAGIEVQMQKIVRHRKNVMSGTARSRALNNFSLKTSREIRQLLSIICFPVFFSSHLCSLIFYRFSARLCCAVLIDEDRIWTHVKLSISLVSIWRNNSRAEQPIYLFKTPTKQHQTDWELIIFNDIWNVRINMLSWVM